VRWLGGGSGAGKSTVARGLAVSYGVGVYSCDDVMADHARRLSPEQAPLLAAFAAMTMDERWVRRSPQEMLETFHWFAGEGFALILEDLAQRPEPIVVVEGFRVLPHLVRPLLVRPDDAVWLLPTEEFRRRAFTERGSLDSIAGRTGDPARALENLLRRDALFTDRLRGDVGDQGIEVGGGVSPAEATTLVARRFRLF